MPKTIDLSDPKPNLVRRLVSKLISLMKWFFIISIVSTILFRFIPIPMTPYIVFSFLEQIFDENRDIRLKKNWDTDIPDKMKLAVICAEDQQFYQHYGFDLVAIKRAMKYNEKGKRIKGGSTISQQTAKNVYLLHHRNYFRKALEAYFTILIEIFWSKDRIIEVYLNVIEFGNGIYGVEAASQHYFKKSVKDLSADQAALLAAVLPNPILYKANKPSRYILKRKSWIKRQMGHFDNLDQLKSL